MEGGHDHGKHIVVPRIAIKPYLLHIIINITNEWISTSCLFLRPKDYCNLLDILIFLPLNTLTSNSMLHKFIFTLKKIFNSFLLSYSLWNYLKDFLHLLVFVTLPLPHKCSLKPISNFFLASLVDHCSLPMHLSILELPFVLYFSFQEIYFTFSIQFALPNLSSVFVVFIFYNCIIDIVTREYSFYWCPIFLN